MHSFLYETPGATERTSFPFAFDGVNHLVATATDANNNTSEFSGSVLVDANVAPVAEPDEISVNQDDGE